MSRRYVVAYRAGNQNVIPVGAENILLEYVEADVEKFRADETPGNPPFFVAYRDVPEWQELNDFERSRAGELP